MDVLDDDSTGCNEEADVWSSQMDCVVRLVCSRAGCHLKTSTDSILVKGNFFNNTEGHKLKMLKQEQFKKYFIC